MINDEPVVVSASVSAAVLRHVLGVVGGFVDLAVVDLVAEKSSVVAGWILGYFFLVVVELNGHLQLSDLVSGS